MQSTQSCITWSGEGPATAGKPQSAADVEFYLDIDPASGLEMVHIADPKPQRRQPEFLVRDISRYAFPASQFMGEVKNETQEPARTSKIAENQSKRKG